MARLFLGPSGFAWMRGLDLDSARARAAIPRRITKVDMFARRYVSLLGLRTEESKNALLGRWGIEGFGSHCFGAWLFRLCQVFLVHQAGRYAMKAGLLRRTAAVGNVLKTSLLRMRKIPHTSGHVLRCCEPPGPHSCGNSRSVLSKSALSRPGHRRQALGSFFGGPEPSPGSLCTLQGRAPFESLFL